MKNSEIRDMSAEELQAELLRLKRHLFDLRSQAVTEKLDNHQLPKQARRDIARVKTAIRALEIKNQQATA